MYSQRRPSLLKPIMHIEYSPHYQKYKFPSPYFRKIYKFPYFRSINFFLPNLRFSAFPFLTMIHLGLCRLYSYCWTPLCVRVSVACRGSWMAGANEVPRSGQIPKFSVVIKNICIFPKRFPISEEQNFHSYKKNSDHLLFSH